MNIKDLVFKDTIAKGYSFIKQCLLKDEWQEGADEYNNAIKQLVDSCMTTEEFVKQYLTHSEWKKEQCYQVMLKQYEPENVWYFMREMFGSHSKKTESDAGALKLGTNVFTINIPNGHGDGTTRYAVLEKSEFYADTIMNYFTTINGTFNVYSYDCGEAVEEELTGKFQIYYYEGLVALVKIEED